MKTCSLCKTSKQLTEFNRNKAKKDGFQSKCRECSAKHGRGYYEANRERMCQQIQERKKEVVADNRFKLFEYLRAHSCVDCGEADPVVLDLDHVRGEKYGCVTTMVRAGCSWSTVEAEIQKCDVRCANCHRRKTAREGGHFRATHSGIVQLAGHLALTQEMAGFKSPSRN